MTYEARLLRPSEMPIQRRLGGAWSYETIMLAAVVPGTLAAAFVTWAIWNSDVLAFPHSNGPIRGAIVLTWVVAGAFTWWRRPTSRFGPLMLAVAFAYAVSALNASSNGYVYSAGRLALATSLVLLIYVALAYPYGRLRRTWDVRVVASTAVATAVVWGGLLLSAERLPRGYSLSDCAGTCPENPFAIAGDTLDDVFTAAARLIAAAALIALIVLLALRVRHDAIDPGRGALPVLCAFALLACSLLAYSLWQPEDALGTHSLQALAAAGALAVPIALVVGQLRANVIVAWGLQRLIVEAGGTRITLERLEGLLREFLSDPTLELATWDPATGHYLSVSGTPVAMPVEGEDRAVKPLEADGTRLGAIIFDPTVDDVSGVAQAVALASMIVYTRTQLLSELRASQARVAEVSTEQRLQLERDLHDGAVQRVLSLQIGLGNLRARVTNRETSREIERLTEQARMIGDDLRNVAHGLYPSVLLERGLVAALVEATFASANRVSIHGDVDRLPNHIERAAYYTILEAVQNVLRHAGAWAKAEVSLSCSDSRLVFAIVDNGVGFDVAEQGRGVGQRSMRQRISAINGTFVVDSRPGHGTRIRGVVPLDAGAGAH